MLARRPRWWQSKILLLYNKAPSVVPVQIVVLVEVLVVLPPLVVDHVPPDAGHGRSTDEGSKQVDLDLNKRKS